MDIAIHNIYMNIAIRDDLKWYSTSKPIQSHGNEISQEALKQTRDIKSPIPEGMLQTSEDQKQSTDKTTTAEIGDEKDEIAATKLLTRRTERGRYREAKSYSNLFAASDTLQEIMYSQIDDLTSKDVFLSSIFKWTLSKEQSITQSKSNFDFFFYMKCDKESLQHDTHSAIRSNLYSNIPALQDLAHQAMVSENYKCLLVIDVPDDFDLELNIALSTKFYSTFLNSTIMIISPFIDMAKIEGKLDKHERVVHVYKKDKHDISDMIKEYVKSKQKWADNVLNQIANDNVNDIRWERFSNDQFLLSLLLFSQHTPSVNDSITTFIISVIDYLIQNSVKNGAVTVDSRQFHVHTKRNENLQRFIIQYANFAKFFPVLLTLGSIAYQNLTGHKTKEPLNGTDEYQRTAAISIGVNVGLLRKTDNESSIEFLHDIFQDVVAALWTVERDTFKECVDTNLTSLQHVPSYAQYLTFLVGIDPKLGPIIAQHMVVLCNKDNRLSEYRQTLGVSPVVAEMNNIWKGIWEEMPFTNEDCPDQYSALVLSDVVQAYQNKYSKLDNLTPAIKEAIISFYLDDVTMEWISYSGSGAFVIFLQQCPNIQKLALTCEALEIIQKSGTNDLLPSLHVLDVRNRRRYPSLPVDWLVLQNVTSLSLYRITFSSHKDKRRFECFVESLKSLKELQLEEIDPEEEMSVRVSSHLKSLTLKIVSLAEIDIQIVSSLESIVVDTLECSDTEIVKIISYIQETKVIKVCDIDFPMRKVRTDIHMLHCKFLRHLRLMSSKTNDIRLTRISETFPHLTVCYLHDITIDGSVCRALETALYSASSLEVLDIDNIRTEWMSVDLSNSAKLRSLKIRQCPVVQMLFCTASLKIIDIDLSNRIVHHTEHVLNTKTENIHGKDTNVGCMTINDKHVRLDISNSSTLNVLKLYLGFKISDIRINVDQLDTITMLNIELEGEAYAQLENIIKRVRKVKNFELNFQTSDRIPRVNLLNCVDLQRLELRNITNASICPWIIRSLRLENLSIRSLNSEEHVGVSDISELLDLVPFTRLEILELEDVDLGDSGLLLTSFNVCLNVVELEDVRMSLSGWFTFVQSLLNIEGCVDVEIMAADIPDEILNIIMSSVMFRISNMRWKDEGSKSIAFEKLERSDRTKHIHKYRDKGILPRVVKPVKLHDVKGKNTLRTRHSIQYSDIDSDSDSDSDIDIDSDSDTEIVAGTR